MKIKPPILLLLNLALIASAQANDQIVSLPTVISGKIAGTPHISFTIKRDSYKATVNHQKGMWSFIEKPNIVLIDINFDGATDVAITGCTSGQCRAEATDVWLYSLSKKTYVHDPSLSRLPNLMISPSAQLLRSGIANTGCAGESFFFNTLLFHNSKLVQIAKQEQICEISGEIVYREFKYDLAGHTTLLKEDKGMPDMNIYQLRQATPPGFINLSDSQITPNK